MMKLAIKFLRRTDTVSESLPLRSNEVINKMVWNNISTISRKWSKIHTPYMLTPCSHFPTFALVIAVASSRGSFPHEWAQMPYKMWRAGGLTKVSKAVGCHILFSFTKKSSPRKKLEDERVEKKQTGMMLKMLRIPIMRPHEVLINQNVFPRRQEGFETYLSTSIQWVCNFLV